MIIYSSLIDILITSLLIVILKKLKKTDILDVLFSPSPLRYPGYAIGQSSDLWSAYTKDPDTIPEKNVLPEFKHGTSCVKTYTPITDFKIVLISKNNIHNSKHSIHYTN